MTKRSKMTVKPVRNFSYSRKTNYRKRRNFLSGRMKRPLTLSRFLVFVTSFALIGTALLYITKAATYQEFQLTDSSVSPTETLQAQPTLRIMEQGNTSAYWYTTGAKVKLHFYDKSSGQTTALQFDGYLPSRSVWNKPDQIVIMERIEAAGIRITHIKLTTGTNGLPVSWSVERQQTFGDSNSRVGDMIVLESGAVVAVWNQQPFDARLKGIAYLASSSASWQVQTTTEQRSGAAKSVLVQHPVDKSVWLFGSADAWATLALIRFTESNATLTVDQVVADVHAGLSETELNLFDMDPENPHLYAVADKLSGEIVVGYQSKKRQYFYDAAGVPKAAGSYPAFARFKADISKTFIQLPVYIERVDSFTFTADENKGLTVAYRPLNTGTFTFDSVSISQLISGSWNSPITFGKGNPSLASPTRTEFVIQRNDDFAPLYPVFVTFETDVTAPVPPADKTPPTVSITSPLNGAVVTGTITVGISASDNTPNGVSKVELVVDGALASTSGAGTSLNISLDTTKLVNSTHSMYAKAYDLAGNTANSSTVSINVSNQVLTPADTLAPQVTISSPAPNAKVGRSVNVTASATDNTGITRMELLVDGKLTATSNSSSLSYNWNTKSLKRGAHTVVVKAYDAAGNIGSTQVTVYK